MSQLKSRLQEDMKSSMKAKEKEKLTTIRSILAAVKQKEIDERIEVDDAQLVQILTKLSKQRKESIAQFEKADRHDLAKHEAFELEIINQYLPKPLDEAEINAAIRQAIEQSGASSIKEMGKVMALLQKSLQGRADMSIVSRLVKENLS